MDDALELAEVAAEVAEEALDVVDDAEEAYLDRVCQRSSNEMGLQRADLRACSVAVVALMRICQPTAGEYDGAERQDGSSIAAFQLISPEYRPRQVYSAKQDNYCSRQRH